MSVLVGAGSPLSVHSQSDARKKLGLAAIVVLLSAALGQVDTSWVRRYNGPGNGTDDAYAVAVDHAGNVYAAGYSFGSGTGADFCVIKYGSDGTQRWLARYNGPASSNDYAYCVGVDSSGNVFVAGNSANSLGTNDYVTVKYDSLGVQQWAVTYDGPGASWDYATAIAVDSRGNPVVTGYSVNTNYDYTTVKYAPDGSLRWVARYNGPANSSDYAQCVTLDLADNVIVSGYSLGTTSYDYATVKYDMDGNPLWAMRYNGTGSGADYAYAVATDASANVYVAGGSYGASGADLDYATVKYDAAGSQLWAARYNGPGNDKDDARSVQADAAGNVYVCGGSNGLGSVLDMTTLCYNAAGAEQWVGRYDGPAGLSDVAYSLGLDSARNVYVAGYSSVTGAGLDATVVKYTPLGNREWVFSYGASGSGNDVGRQVKVDAYGSAHMAGYTPGTGLDMLVIKLSQPDAAATAVTAPVGRLDTLAVVVPQATVQNLGSAPASFMAYFRIRTLGGVLMYLDSAAVAGLMMGASQQVAFDTWYGPHALGLYVTRCSVAVRFDRFGANDTADGGFTVVAGAPGWAEVTSMPATPSYRDCKDGGRLAYCAGNGLVYALKGNKTGDFYSFNPMTNGWLLQPPVPLGSGNKPVSKGAALTTDGSGYVYCVKGNNTFEFWRYSIAGGNWSCIESVPLGPYQKRVKGGGDMVYIDGYCYFLKGYKNEFYRYSTSTHLWESLPSAPSPGTPKWDKGSFAVTDGRYIYGCKAKYNELWRYDANSRVWGTSPLAPMPFFGASGATKKLKDGGCGVWYDGCIYALKGGNTQEFWCYNASRNVWTERETIPKFGSSMSVRRVKPGADIASVGFAFYATKGGKTREMWRYILPTGLDDGVDPERDVMTRASRPTGDSRTARPVVWPNPCRTTVNLSLPAVGPASIALVDVSGREVLRMTGKPDMRCSAVRVNVSDLPHGLYLLRADQSGRVTTARLTVE